MPPKSMRVLVIVPAWNEAASVADVVRNLVAEQYDVLVVDDGSTDGTRGIGSRCRRDGDVAALQLGCRRSAALWIQVRSQARLRRRGPV